MKTRREIVKTYFKNVLNILISISIILIILYLSWNIIKNRDNGTPNAQFKSIRQSERSIILQYDVDTYIVYYIQYTYRSNVRIPYIAENGLPYRYNIETNELELIQGD